MNNKSSPRVISNEINKFFAEVGTNLAVDIPTVDQEIISNFIQNEIYPPVLYQGCGNIATMLWYNVRLQYCSNIVSNLTKLNIVTMLPEHNRALTGIWITLAPRAQDRIDCARVNNL